MNIPLIIAVALILFRIYYVTKHEKRLRLFRQRFEHQARQFGHASLGKPLFHLEKEQYVFFSELGYDEAYQELICILHSIDVVLSSYSIKHSKIMFEGSRRGDKFKFTFETQDKNPYDLHEKQFLFSVR